MKHLKPTGHLAASAVISASIFLTTKSVTVAGASFFCGFLIDVDHILDHVREYGSRADIREFFRNFHETRFKKLLLIFHAWEWAFCLLLLAWLSGWNELCLGIFIGVFQHLLLDQIANGVTPWGYFIVYRAMKGFSMEKIVRKEMVQRKRNRMNG